MLQLLAEAEGYGPTMVGGVKVKAEEPPVEMRLQITPSATLVGRVVQDLDGEDVGVERAMGTDPLDPDTDGDGVSDGVEANMGTVPLDDTDYLAAITYDGDLVLSTDGASFTSASLIATLRDNGGNVLALDDVQVLFELRAEGVSNVITFASSEQGVASAVRALEPGIYMLEVLVPGTNFTTQAELVIYNPDGGFAVGGGWFIPNGDDQNSHPPNRNHDDNENHNHRHSHKYLHDRAHFSFMTQYKKGQPRGYLLFSYDKSDCNLLTLSIQQFVITGGHVRVNGKKIIVCFDRRSHNPIIAQAGLDSQEISIPWLEGKSLRFEFK